MSPPGPLSRVRLLGFAVGSIGSAMFFTIPGLVLLFYLTNVLDVPASLAALVVGGPKFWDVLFDPCVGAMSDREAQRTGRRTRLMLIGALLLPPAFVLMFASPFTGATGALWVGLSFMLAATAFAFFQVPYVALPTEISDDPAQRSRAMTWRIVGVTLGIVLAGASATAIVDAAGFFVMGLLFALVMGALMLTAALSSRWIASRPGPEPLSIMQSLRVARGNRPFFALLAGYVIQSLGVAIFLAAIGYVAVYCLGDLKRSSLLFAGFVAPSVVAVPLWNWLGQRWGRARAYVAASVLIALACLALLPVLMHAPIEMGRVLALSVLAGIGFGGQQVLPAAMVPDTILADAERTGQVQAGTFNGAWAALETAAYALGPTLFALVLALGGYRSSSSLAKPLGQPDSALTAILFSATVLPALLMLAGVPLIRWSQRLSELRSRSSRHRREP
ncbi:MAG TPA: MFS transporter [Burkholderiaceae bacterium]|jgi:Na+/melibiose symporter-like transporter